MARLICHLIMAAWSRSNRDTPRPAQHSPYRRPAEPPVCAVFMSTRWRHGTTCRKASRARLSHRAWSPLHCYLSQSLTLSRVAASRGPH